MRCGRCGNDNADSNRFCGMCGAALVAKDVAKDVPKNVAKDVPKDVTKPQAAEQVAPVYSGAMRTVERPAPQPAERVISGPSFLGLSTPGPASNGHSYGRDPLPPSSGNLDYLLDDEEEPKRGAGKLILILLALALAGGFGYLHWKQGGFDWLNAGNKKPSATAPDAGQNSDSSGSTTPTRPPEPAPGQQNSAQDNSPAAPPQNPPAQNPAQQNPASDAAAAPNAASSDTSAQNTVPQSQTNNSTTSPDSEAQPANSDAQPSPPAETPAPKANARKPASTKPSSARAPAAKPYDQVAEAERYIYGRSGRQDCDHGMRLLKSVADQSNPKAMISMGALYSTGTCTPRDLPTAYRWFALALHKQPDNQALQEDLKSLWEKMTQPERQLAIKLSQ